MGLRTESGPIKKDIVKKLRSQLLHMYGESVFGNWAKFVNTFPVATKDKATREALAVEIRNIGKELESSHRRICKVADALEHLPIK